MAFIKNPVLTGFNPDPVLFKDDKHYYLAVSTFEWLPGIRVYVSDDLVNWKYETSILNDPKLVDLNGKPTGGSIWAPFIKYHNGTYYAVYTVVNATRVPYKDVDNYITKASNIHGPWSEPVYVNSSGFDPSLFIDDDDEAYFINEIWDYRLSTHNKSAGVVCQKISLDDFHLEGVSKKIFLGTKPQKTEAPQIYKHNDWYYLLCAEGGTGVDEAHQETVARSKNIWGPYEVDPHNPMLTSKDHPEINLQSSGHASLMETNDHEWYIAHLCTRPLDGVYPILGRETAIQKVQWTSSGWLELTTGKNVPSDEVQAPKFVEESSQLDNSFEDSFTSNNQIDPEHWNVLRNFSSDEWLLPSEKGLTIKGGQSPQSAFEQHIVGTRQADFKYHASVDMYYKVGNYLQLAGMALYLDLSNFILVMITASEEGKPCVVLQQEVNGEFKQISINPIDDLHNYRFEIVVENNEAEFTIHDSNSVKQLGKLDISFLSGGFTGNFISLDVIDMERRNNSQATFTNFKYASM